MIFKCGLSHFNCCILSPSVISPLSALVVPEKLSLSENLDAQQLSISWVGGTTTTFDLLILRTEFNETVFYVRAFILLSIHLLMLVSLLYCLSKLIFSVLCRKRSLCHWIWQVASTSGPGPQLNPWSVPLCQSKFAQEMDREQVTGATHRYFKVRRAVIPVCYQWQKNSMLLNKKTWPFFLLDYQDVTYPATPTLSCTHRIKLYLWEPAPLSVALWRRGRAFLSSGLAWPAQCWTQHDSAGGHTLLWWSIASRLTRRESTSFVTATLKKCWVDLWYLPDVRQIYITKKVVFAVYFKCL